MGKIVISESVSLDGVIQAGEDGFERGGWFTRIGDRDREEWAKAEFEEALGAEALLLGRRTYAWFVTRGWASRTGEWADRLRSLPKYVVSSAALEAPDWNNSTVLKGDVVNEVSKLKQQVNGDIVVYGSGRLVAHADRARPRRRAAADDLPVRGRGGRAALRRDQRREAHAPRRHPHRR